MVGRMYIMLYVPLKILYPFIRSRSYIAVAPFMCKHKHL